MLLTGFKTFLLSLSAKRSTEVKMRVVQPPTLKTGTISDISVLTAGLGNM